MKLITNLASGRKKNEVETDFTQDSKLGQSSCIKQFPLLRFEEELNDDLINYQLQYQRNRRLHETI